jgi:hypothetical protein
VPLVAVTFDIVAELLLVPVPVVGRIEVLLKFVDR